MIRPLKLIANNDVWSLKRVAFSDTGIIMLHRAYTRKFSFLSDGGGAVGN
jgi:hypothetical protein